MVIVINSVIGAAGGTIKEGFAEEVTSDKCQRLNRSFVSFKVVGRYILYFFF